MNRQEDFRARLKKYDTYSPRSSRPYAAEPVNRHRQHTVNEALPAPVRLPNLQHAEPAGLPKSKLVQPSRALPGSEGRSTLALKAVAGSQVQVERSFASSFVAVELGEKPSFFKRLVNIAGFAVFILAMGVSVQTLLVNMQNGKQAAVLAEQQTVDAQGVTEGTGDNPSEETIDETAFWSYKPINPEHPRYLRIPDISVYARIKSIGLTEDGAVDAPKNIHDVGWYNNGTAPGSSTGSSLLMGHLSGWTRSGIFKKLPQMQEGMRFSVEKGSGEVVNYEVYRTQKFSLEELDMKAILNADTPGIHDLKLMTCSGKYDNAQGTYLDRFVVYARQVE